MNIAEAKDIANWIRDMEAREATQAAELKETRAEIKDAKDKLVGGFADKERPLLPEEDDEK